MLPEELARVKIDKQLSDAGWDIVSRTEYIPNTASAVKEALMKGCKESDYLLFVEDKAIAVVEAKKEDNIFMRTWTRAEKTSVQRPSAHFSTMIGITTERGADF